MQQEFWRQTRDLRDNIERFIQENIVPAAGGFGQAPIDVYESDSGYVVVASLPGAQSDKLTITAHGSSIRVSGTFGAPAAPAGYKAVRQGLARGSFERTIDLPSAVDAEAASASFEGGMLRLTLPKAPTAQPRPIALSQSAEPARTTPAITQPAPLNVGASSAALPTGKPILDDDDYDEVDLESDQSFPASDPPSSIPGKV